jgi:hypothetical protein
MQPLKDDSAGNASNADRLPFFHAHRRLMLCAGLLLAVAGGLYAAGLPPSLAILLGFDAGALIFLILTARVFGRTSAAAPGTPASTTSGAAASSGAASRCPAWCWSRCGWKCARRTMWARLSTCWPRP